MIPEERKTNGAGTTNAPAFHIIIFKTNTERVSPTRELNQRTKNQSLGRLRWLEFVGSTTTKKEDNAKKEFQKSA